MGLAIRNPSNLLRAALLAGACFVAVAADAPFVTSDPNGGWSNGGYYVHNNVWNGVKYNPCVSTLSAWSADHWQAVAKMDNKSGDGAVKAYPNVHKDYKALRIDSIDAMTSVFAETSPQVGIYDFAYDIWINGVATPGCAEIMIWNENFHQVPGGNHAQDAVFDGRTYRVYKRRSDRYIAFVAATNFTSGTVDLLAMMKWTMAKGWIAPTSTVNQVCFGVEVVSMDDTEARFQVSAFSIDSKPKP